MEWDFTPEDVRSGKRMKDDISIGIEPDCFTHTITDELMTF
jgi:hypothetical protein